MYGPLVIGIVFASTALSVGASQYAFGLFIEPLEQQFGWTRTEISASLSFAAMSGLASPLIGRAMDRYGARPILVASLLVGGTSFVLRPAMTELWHWYALSFLQFVAFSGATSLPMGKLVANWYPHARGRVMAIAVTGNNIGGLLIPATILTTLTVATWREGYLSLAVMSFALAAIAYFFVHEQPPDNAAQSRPSHRHRSSSTTATVQHVTLKEAVRSRAFYSVLIVIITGSFTYSIILPHVLAHLMTYGMNRESASFTLGTLAMSGIAGKLIFGLLCERVGARRATITNLFGQATFAALLATATSTQALVWLTPIFGIFMGGLGALMVILVQDTFGLKHFGSIMGLTNMGMVLSFGLGPLFAGASYDLTGSYGAAFLLAAALFTLGAIVLLLSRLPNRMNPQHSAVD
ncbi:MAG: sugar phosphate permease [Gammaproteobacteria bacterium]|jgi:sugar phosphate permease